MKNGDRSAAPAKGHSGLTKREYFAAVALQGLLGDSNVRATHSEFAVESVEAADALLVALEDTT